MPPGSSAASLAVFQELGKNYENNWFSASMAVYNSLGDDNNGVYKISLYKRDCFNKAANYTGVTDKFSITGIENKNFKTGEVVMLNVGDYAKYAGGDYRFKQKDLNKFVNKLQDLLTKRADYEEVKEFEF